MENQPDPPYVETAPMPPAAVLKPGSKVEIRSVALNPHFTVWIDNVHVSINEWWNWPSQEAAQAAVDTLPRPE